MELGLVGQRGGRWLFANVTSPSHLLVLLLFYLLRISLTIR